MIEVKLTFKDSAEMLMFFSGTGTSAPSGLEVKASAMAEPKQEEKQKEKQEEKQKEKQEEKQEEKQKEKQEEKQKEKQEEKETPKPEEKETPEQKQDKKEMKEKLIGAIRDFILFDKFTNMRTVKNAMPNGKKDLKSLTMEEAQEIIITLGIEV